MSAGWNKKQTKWAAGIGAVAVIGAWLMLGSNKAPPGHASSAQASSQAASGAPKPALSVQVVSPQSSQWPSLVTANGSIAAWQDAVIGAELAGLRLSAVLVNVGDRVTRGQTLATLSNDAVRADVNTARANLNEAIALLGEAKGNANRARTLRAGNAISEQESLRSITAEQTAQARVDSARARLAADELRLSQTRVAAPDDGVISARVATVGAVVQPGQELFRLIRQSRLEWRAEVPAADLGRIKPGMMAWATPAGGDAIQGRVRSLAPTVDAASRNGLVYVDLPPAATSAAKAGMFASGRFEVGQSQGLTLPQSAVVLRDGFSYVFKVSQQGKVAQSKVQLGRRVGDRVEVTQGVDAHATVVASGGGFLADGDQVKVVSSTTAPEKGSQP